MKINRKLILLLAVGVPVILLGGLGMTRSQQFEEQSRLRVELSSVKQKLDALQAERISSPEKGMQKQINEVSEKVKEAEATLSPYLSSISTSERLLDIAHSCGITSIEISSSGLTNQKYNELKCEAMSMKFVGQGEIPNLVYFVQKVNNDHVSGAVDSVVIDIAEMEVSIQFNEYTYTGE